MALSILQRPYQTINGLASKWNAVGNPLLYKMSTPSFGQTGYYLEVYVFDGNDTALNTEAFTYTPDSVGNITADISAIIRANLAADNDIDLTNTNVELYNDTNAYKKFYIKTKEVWSGSANALVSDSTNQFFAVLGAMQIPATYGPNLYDYTCFSVFDYAEAKFLTVFEKPVWWRGWPFVLSAIIDTSLTASINLKVVADTTIYAGQQIGNSGRLVECYFGFVGAGVIDGSTSAIVSIVDFTTPTNAYSEGLEVELRDACDEPIMLMGRNRLGGVLQWVFDVRQEYTFDYGNGRKAKRLVLSTNNITINQWEALQDFITLGDVYRNNITEFLSTTIKTSTRIGAQVYAVTQAGSKTGVIVVPSRNRTTTDKVKHSFELEIEYPEVFVP